MVFSVDRCLDVRLWQGYMMICIKLQTDFLKQTIRKNYLLTVNGLTDYCNVVFRKKYTMRTD